MRLIQFLICLLFVQCGLSSEWNFKSYVQNYFFKSLYNFRHPTRRATDNLAVAKTVRIRSFENYLLKDDDSYCESNLVKRSLDNVPDSHSAFALMIVYLIARAINPNDLAYVELERPYHPRFSPFRTIIVRNAANTYGASYIVPVYLAATIRPSHIRSTDREPIPSFIRNYLENLVTRLPNDHAGHLLAGCLGGPSFDQFNFSPQTARLNTNSRWSQEELAMRSFLMSDDGTGRRRIEWQLLVLYGSSSTRPIGFCMTHQNYNEAGQLVDNDNQPISQSLPLICFSNNPDDPCLFQEYN